MKKVVNKEKMSNVFLMEMKTNKEWMEKVKDKCSMKHGLIVPSSGKSGGLAMLWKEGIMVDVIGDFNEIVGLSKKEGGSIRPRHQMEKFSDVKL